MPGQSWAGAELVRELRRLTQMSVVRMQVALGRLGRGMTEEALQHVRRDARIGAPGHVRVLESVPFEALEPEPCDELIPLCRAPHRGRREYSTEQPAEPRIFRVPAIGEADVGRPCAMPTRSLSSCIQGKSRGPCRRLGLHLSTPSRCNGSSFRTVALIGSTEKSCMIGSANTRPLPHG